MKTGKAVIRTVLDNNEVKEYEINITKIDKKSEIKRGSPSKGRTALLSLLLCF